MPPKQKLCPKRKQPDRRHWDAFSIKIFFLVFIPEYIFVPPPPYKIVYASPSTLFLRLACLKITRSHLFQPFISNWVETFSFLFEDHLISKAVCQMISYRADLTFYNLFCNSHQIFVKNIRFPPKSKVPQISI